VHTRDAPLDLSGVILSGANLLSRADLIDADLIDANLRKTYMHFMFGLTREKLLDCAERGAFINDKGTRSSIFT